jgi:hypothetical protein
VLLRDYDGLGGGLTVSDARTQTGMRSSSRKLLQALGCLLCAVPAFVQFGKLDGSEFSGGTVTGPMLSSAAIAIVLLLLALALSFLWLRVAAVCALVAAVLFLPLYLCLTHPGVVQWIFPGEWTVHYGLWTFFRDGWSVAGIALTVFLACVCAGSLASKSKER